MAEIAAGEEAFCKFIYMCRICAQLMERKGKSFNILIKNVFYEKFAQRVYIRRCSWIEKSQETQESTQFVFKSNVGGGGGQLILWCSQSSRNGPEKALATTMENIAKVVCLLNQRDIIFSASALASNILTTDSGQQNVIYTTAYPSSQVCVPLFLLCRFVL